MDKTHLTREKFVGFADLILQGPPAFYKFIGPKSIQLEITNKCNVRCVMCDRWKWKSQADRPELSTEELFDLFDQFKECGVQHILITGGEPFTRPDFKVIINQIVKVGMSLTIITNGTLLRKSDANALLQGKTSVTFSVDGSSEESYSRIRGVKGIFNKIIDNIKDLISLKDNNPNPNVTMHYVVQRKNAGNIYEFHELASQLNVDNISYGLVHGPHVVERRLGLNEKTLEHVKKQFKRIEQDKENKGLLEPIIRDELEDVINGKINLDEIKDGLLAYPLFKKNPMPCFSLSYWALVDAFGDVYPCCYAYYDNLSFEDYKEKRLRFVLGNIREQSFSSIWEGPKFNHLRELLNPVNVDDFPEVCGNCGSYHYFSEFNETHLKLQGVIKDENKTPEEKMMQVMEIFSKFLQRPIDRATRSYEEEFKGEIEKKL